MLIDLSSVLSEPHEPLEKDVPITLTEIEFNSGRYPVLEKSDLHLTVTFVEEGRVEIQGQCEVVLELVCDRCLDRVPFTFDLDFVRRTAVAGADEEAELSDTDEPDAVEGYMLDTDQLVRSEILIGWPMKVLCREDCKGICSICGQNLNHGTCDCVDTGLDPRMAAARDVFKNFKEV